MLRTLVKRYDTRQIHLNNVQCTNDVADQLADYIEIMPQLIKIRNSKSLFFFFHT